MNKEKSYELTRKYLENMSDEEIKGFSEKLAHLSAVNLRNNFNREDNGNQKIFFSLDSIQNLIVNLTSYGQEKTKESLIYDLIVGIDSFLSLDSELTKERKVFLMFGDKIEDSIKKELKKE